jgi:acetyl coenzyme A synthetase (ADP forming)-like protein
VSDPTLTPFFNPRGVAVIGASREPTKLGYGLARNLVMSGYQGAIHFVNPKGDELFGRPIYATIAAVPDPVDLAVLLVAPQFALDTLRQCGQRGIRAVILASGGFRETGAEGAALENECSHLAASLNMRLVGPNCVGWINTHLPIDTTFLPPPPPPAGEVAFISHSGAICAAITDWVRGQGFGLSHLISLGNNADVNETDVLEPVVNDVHTRVLTLYLEAINRGQRFLEQARLASQKKPVIALKVGRFEAGKRAAASHTGALAGAETAYDAAFRKAGVMRANTTEEMFQWARALAWSPLPRGRQVAVLTNAGGPGVTAADALELHGLTLAELSQESEKAMKAFLPAAASLHNPVDMLASASPENYADSLRILLADPGVDSVMVIIPPPPSFTVGGVVRALIPVVQVNDKPVVMVLMGEKLIQEGIEHSRAARIPEYRFPEDAASALGALCQRMDILQRFTDRAETPGDIDSSAAYARLKNHPSSQWLSQDDALGVLQAYHIPTLPVRLAENAAVAASVANDLGYPVVLKVASADIAHKSDVGGVLLNLKNEEEVRQGFETVTMRARQARPNARIEGVLVQRMIGAGQEVIVGVVRDVQFGPLVMFGSGGVDVEGLKDVAFALAPLTRPEAEGLLESTWAGRKLKGFRSLVAADRSSVVDALIRLAQLAYDHPQIAEIEINPLRVMPEGQGAFAIDVRARLV